MDSSSYPEAPRDIGRVIAGRYRLTRRLGIGSSSEVYQAENLATGGTCAVKLLHREHLGISAARTRFAREVRLLARFDHPNIVRVHDAGDDPLDETAKTERQLYFVMPVLRGDSLRTILRHHAIDPLPWREGAVLVADLLRALVELHGAGVLHRDLKPGNAIITRGPDRMTLVLIDLGLAADLNDPSLHPNRRFGSPPYLAPERWRGEAADARSDVYAAGAIFYEMLTGTPPFHASERLELREQHLQSPVTPPRERAPRAQIPEEIQALVLRALAKRREHRFADATTFLSELEETRERLIHRLPHDYRLLPRDLRGWSAPANDPTTDVPAAVRTPGVANADAGRSQRRMVLLTGSLLGAALATAILSLWTTLASVPTLAFDPPADVEPAAPEKMLVSGAVIPTGAPTTGAPAELCDAVERPAADDPSQRPDELPRAVQARVRDAKRLTPVNVQQPRTETTTSEQARRVATQEPVLVALRACPGVPVTIIAELDIVEGRGAVVTFNRHEPGHAVSWHPCARGVLEGLEYPRSTSAARVRLRLELR